MKKLIPLLVLMLTTHTAFAEPADLVQAIRAVNKEADAIKSEAHEAAELSTAIKKYETAWIAETNRVLNDPDNPLQRQIRAAAEIPFPKLMTGHQASIVIGRNTDGTHYLGYAPRGNPLSATMLPAVVNEAALEPFLDAGLSRERIRRVTRQHLIEALRAVEADAPDNDKALQRAIEKQERGELPAGRAEAYRRLLNPLFGPGGPVASALPHLPEYSQPRRSNFFQVPLLTSAGPLLLDGQPASLQLGLVSESSGKSVPAITVVWPHHSLAGDQMQHLAEPAAAPPALFVEAAARIVNRARARTSAHLAQVRDKHTRLGVRPPTAHR